MKTFVRFILVSALVLGLHALLIHWMAEHNVVSIIFCAGAHVPFHLMALAGVFIFVRLWVVLFLPGLLLYHAARALLGNKWS
jgi:hypothetical protein